MVPALQRTTSTAQAFMPLIWLPPFNLELHSFVTLLIYPALFLPFILVLIVWSCWNFHTICSPHLQVHCVGHLVGRFHCCQVSFLFSFPRQLTCLAQTTFWCILITSLPLLDGRCASCPLLVCIQLSPVLKLESVKKKPAQAPLHAVTDYRDFILVYPNHLKIHE